MKTRPAQIWEELGEVFGLRGALRDGRLVHLAASGAREYTSDPGARLHGNPTSYRQLPERLREHDGSSLPVGHGAHVVLPGNAYHRLDRVIGTVAVVASRSGAVETIARHHGFGRQQARYYAGAAAYLGWLVRGGRGEPCRLTEAGRTLHEADEGERPRRVAHQLARRIPLRRALRAFGTEGRIPDPARLQAIVRDARDGLGATTAARRARTLRSWLRWLVRNGAIVGADEP